MVDCSRYILEKKCNTDISAKMRSEYKLKDTFAGLSYTSRYKFRRTLC